MLVSKAKPCMSRYGSKLRHCEWLIKPVIIYLVAPFTRIPVVNLGLIRAAVLTSGRDAFIGQTADRVRPSIGETW